MAEATEEIAKDTSKWPAHATKPTSRVPADREPWTRWNQRRSNIHRGHGAEPAGTEAKSASWPHPTSRKAKVIPEVGGYE
jgi:hypothetical protein